MSYDRAEVFGAQALPGEEGENAITLIKETLRRFILEFRLDDSFVYR